MYTIENKTVPFQIGLHDGVIYLVDGVDYDPPSNNKVYSFVVSDIVSVVIMKTSLCVHCHISLRDGIVIDHELKCFLSIVTGQNVHVENVDSSLCDSEDIQQQSELDTQRLVVTLT